jgi:intracellular protein transport protein USO1
MMRILEAQAPARQNATDTIQTLAGRLASATLLEDRRAAIQGLRSFAKLYPASVASGALRDLIAGLRKDADDSDTVKILLETLLGLFEPDEKSTEASEEITLWLADEFTQRQDNITALLDLLETNEFYMRLYVLQILGHISTARPQRTQEAVFAAPLGISRISNVLDDKREAVRNEALVLLVALTPTSAEIQKVVAFENAFDRVFALVDGDGGLSHGSTMVQDCLSLLANLLNLNTSNQSYFREVGGILKIKKLLIGVIDQENSADGVSEWMKPQRDMNVWGLLGVVQMFLPQGAQGTMTNQQAFWQGGVLDVILRIAFHPSFTPSVRRKCLQTCGDIIRGNHGLQERFGDLNVQIKESDTPQTNGHSTSEKVPQPPKATFRIQNVIESLLELTLEVSPISMFDVRLASCSCVEAFINGHPGIRSHVLNRAIEGHKAGNDAIPNILTVLLEPPGSRMTSDPYQQWFAAVLLMHLLFDNTETKQSALKVTEGDADSGEEVVTFLQSIASNVVAGVQHVENERALLGYLMLLIIWLFEDPEAVNDFLGEGSNVQGLIAAVKITRSSMPLVAGLSAFTLGIIYEFSTKDSPLPRKTLHELLNGKLGREAYVDRLTKLRENPFVRDFEVLPQAANGSLPDVFFDKVFIDFLKDNYSRILRAIDRDPNFEVSVVSNGVQKGVSRELVDTLRAQVEEQRKSLEEAASELLQLKRRLEQEELDHRRTRESSTVELGRIKQINQSLQNNHEDEVTRLQQQSAQDRQALLRSHEEETSQRRNEHLQALETLNKQHATDIQQLQQRMQSAMQETATVRSTLTDQHRQALDALASESQKSRDREAAEISDLRAQIATLESQIHKAESNYTQDLRTANDEYESRSKALQERLARADARAKELAEEIKSEQSKRQEVQTELDDFMVVFTDLELKRKGEKAKLKELGEDVSEDEDDGDGEGNEEEDGDGDGDDDVD